MVTSITRGFRYQLFSHTDGFKKLVGYLLNVSSQASFRSEVPTFSINNQRNKINFSILLVTEVTARIEYSEVIKKGVRIE